jgi:hypothetical protein
MSQKKTKTEKVDAAIQKGKKAAEAAKEFTPPEVDAMIDRGTQAVEVGWSLSKFIRNILKKK